MPSAMSQRGRFPMARGVSAHLIVVCTSEADRSLDDPLDSAASARCSLPRHWRRVPVQMTLPLPKNFGQDRLDGVTSLASPSGLRRFAPVDRQVTLKRTRIAGMLMRIAAA